MVPTLSEKVSTSTETVPTLSFQVETSNWMDQTVARQVARSTLDGPDPLDAPFDLYRDGPDPLGRSRHSRSRVRTVSLEIELGKWIDQTVST